MTKAAVLLMVFGLMGAGCGPQPLSSHSHPRSKPNGHRPCGREADRRVVDLTHVLQPGMPAWPGEAAFSMTDVSGEERAYRLHKIESGGGVGTHVDAPGQFVEGKRGIDQIPTYELVIPVAVLSVREKVKDNPDYVVGGNDIVDWEAIHGPIPVGAVFVVNTGWYERFNDPDKYLNVDAQGGMHFPGLSKAAAQLLVERDVVGVGIDTLSIDPGASAEFAAHKVMHAADKYQIENMNNLNELPETGATLIVGVLPVADASQAPARVLALVPEQPPTDEEEN